MSRALQLARQPVAAPHPNPRVGCVIAEGAEVVGEGFHERAGHAHAEIDALKSLRKGLSDAAIMYVTLEPCAYHGRTAPCVDSVIESGIRHVVVGVQDPHPGTNGNGIVALRESGIDVRVGLLGDAVRELNRGFHVMHESGRPWVTVKVASTIDGGIATAAGESAWITGREARSDVQLLRAQSAAVLTGSGTVRMDNPRLNCRLPGVDSGLVRVIADSRLSISENARLFDCEGGIIVATTPNHDRTKRRVLDKYAQVIEVADDGNGRVDCSALLGTLAQDHGISTILVEAGPRFVGSLLEHRLVDELVFYVAPSMLGCDSIGIADLPGLARLSQRVQLEFQEVVQIGEDIRIRANVKRDARENG